MITSLTNNQIKLLKKLNQKKYRNKYNQYVVEGFHLVDEAYSLKLIDTIFYTDINSDYRNVKSFLVTPEIMKNISNVETPQGVLAICNKTENTKLSQKILLLDSIQDPGNSGTIMRSAIAFGFNTIVAENTVDFYNEKVIRSSQGAIFKVNIINTNLNEFIENNKANYYLYGTDVSKGKDLSQINFNKNNVMLILGNEGNGVREEISQKADENIKIEMGNMESLNVSIAGSIIMYEIYKGCR